MFKYYRIIRGRLSSAYHKRSLQQILTSADPNAPLNEQVVWLRRFFDWLGTSITPGSEAPSAHAQSIRLKLLNKTLNENPLFKTNSSKCISIVLRETDPLDFFCDAGMITSQGFIKELFVRLALRYLPAHKDYRNLSILAEDVLHGAEDAAWIENLDPKLLIELGAQLTFDSQLLEDLKEKYMFAIHQACKILAARLASLSSAAEFRNRVPIEERFLLVDLTEHRSEAILQRAGRVMDNVYQSLEGSGVSIELVFLLERMKGLLSRLKILSAVAANPMDLENSIFAICKILRDQDDKNSIIGFLGSNLNLISKKIVERAGVSGENYVARGPSETKALFWSAAGGGGITVLTTLLKSGITKAGLPLFFEGFLAWINYTLSFMLIQFSHMTLATKTPAMTAPILASKLREVRSTEKQKEFLIEVKHIFRSSFVAVIGNVLFVMMVGVLIDYIYFKISGSHLFGQESGLKNLRDHHLFTSLTIWYAAYTGAALWFGSAIGGWFENWYTYRGINQAIDESFFLKAIFGQDRTSRLSKWMNGAIMGIATNVALGFLLAFSSIFGKFFGIPIDVRHVTLASGTLALSIASLENVKEHAVLIGFSVVSILFIGLLNVGVSFVISLFIAAQAREVKLSQYPKLFRHWFSRN